MGALTFRQWLKIIAAAPALASQIRAAIPVLRPLLKRMTALLDALELDEPVGTPTVPPEDIVELPHDLTPEDQELFDRMSKNIG